jgi:hypothetical protein
MLLERTGGMLLERTGGMLLERTGGMLLEHARMLAATEAAVRSNSILECKCLPDNGHRTPVSVSTRKPCGSLLAGDAVSAPPSHCIFMLKGAFSVQRFEIIQGVTSSVR